ncbi:MAG: polysaccharide deacetylase family protein [Bacteroidales bacterium]|jgi:peptidoglycan/xylan/chitin deacetylase (PgdA/CDA1 family)|nr:polysaccharide deacetylase family protein [Bacteroidales bacterium]
MKRYLLIYAGILLICSCCSRNSHTGETTVTKWQDGKKGAVSLTYDDGSINQFRKALPIMNELDFPATFFINTGQIQGSKYRGTFIGRPVNDIIKETANVPTNSDNFFERASAARFLGLRGTGEYHTNAGAQIDEGSPEEAYRIMDELYKKVRNGEFAPVRRSRNDSESEGVSWDDIRSFAAQGHEFASHMVTHPRLAALDEANILYELEKSREEILNQLGPEHTFSAEVPYGTENERAMEYAYKVYPALRNRMPEAFLKELNRSSREDPVSADKEYVQWQRGATTKTPMPLMKSWIDTTASHDNIWLVLVFHGVDGIGWEALTSEAIEEYFRYMKDKEEHLWIATFGDAAKYMRERIHSTIRSEHKKGSIKVNLNHSLDTSSYNLPLTLKTYVPSGWKKVIVKQGDNITTTLPQKDTNGSFVFYRSEPNSVVTELLKGQADPV